jgi:3-hydroxyisobutyrate dehydrogenase-like beta-hydroxyacid dehydrogenase
MTTDREFDLLASRIECILKLLALQTTSGKKAGEASVLLERAGLDRKTIAEVLNTSQDSVRSLLSQHKKQTKPKEKEAELVSEEQ